MRLLPDPGPGGKLNTDLEEKLMDIFRRGVGVVLIVIGAVVAVHMIAQPLYDASSEASPHNPIWSIINPFMALAVVLGVIFGYIRKRGVDHEGGGAPITREFLSANTLFYGFLDEMTKQMRRRFSPEYKEQSVARPVGAGCGRRRRLL